jgi:hypothetical protein
LTKSTSISLDVPQANKMPNPMRHNTAFIGAFFCGQTIGSSGGYNNMMLLIKIIITTHWVRRLVSLFAYVFKLHSKAWRGTNWLA